MTEEQSPGNPFYPGMGSVPDHLAGREEEQALLKKSLAAICGERESRYEPLRARAPQPLRIIGPRGVGKTALLAWLKSVVDPEKVDVVRLADPPDGDSNKELSKFLRKLADIPGFDWKSVESQVFKYIHLVRNWQPGQPPLEDFEGVLQERLRLRPLLMLLDEVMHYDPKMLKTILQQSQILASDRWPLAIVLAGTPALNVHLQKVDATFIDRTEDIFINRLDSDATREALGRPFLDRGVMVAGEALELMVSWSDNYPFFIQIVGSVVWDAKKGAAKVDVALVQSVEQAVQVKRNRFYGKIFERISTSQLLEHAMKAVAAIEAAPEPLVPEQVRARMAEGTGLDAEEVINVYNKLQDAGLFWHTGDRNVIAAIPSFFNYFKTEYKRTRS